MNHSFCARCFWLICALFVASALPAQGTLSTIRGIIKDAKSGVPLADVKITLVAPQTKTQYTIASDKNGAYYKTGLYPALYEITFEKEAYAPASTTIRLRAGDTHDVNANMQPSEIKGPQGIFNKALVLVRDGNYAEAAAALTSVLAEDGTNYLAYYYRGFCYEKSGNPESAMADYQKSVELNPGFVLGLCSLAKLYARKGDYQNAVAWYQKADKLNMTDVISINNYGVSLVNLARNEEAKVVFEKLLALDPENADGYYQLGLIYLGLGDTARARELLEKFLLLDPQNQNAAIAQQILKTLK